MPHAMARFQAVRLIGQHTHARYFRCLDAFAEYQSFQKRVSHER